MIAKLRSLSPGTKREAGHIAGGAAKNGAAVAISPDMQPRICVMKDGAAPRKSGARRENLSYTIGPK